MPGRTTKSARRREAEAATKRARVLLTPRMIRGRSPQPQGRVHGRPRVADLEIEALDLVFRRLAEDPHPVADRDALAACDRARHETAVEREHAVAMVHDNEVSVALEPLRVDDIAREDGAHGR